MYDYNYIHIEEDGLTDINGDVAGYFRDIENLYYQAKSLYRDAYNNRDYWYTVLDEVESPFPESFEQNFVREVVLNSGYTLINEYEFETEISKDEFFDDIEDDDRYTMDFSERGLTFLKQGELLDGIEIVDETKIDIFGYFTIELPISTQLLATEFQLAEFIISYDEDSGEFETEFYAHQSQFGPPIEDDDLMEYLYKSTRTRTQKEAYTIYTESPHAVLVAVGHRDAGSCQYPNRIKHIKQFPVEAIVWDSEHNREASRTADESYDDESINDCYSFIYNTERLTKEEMKEKLKEAFDGEQKSMEAYGQMMGYPDWAVTYFSEKVDQGIAPHFSNLIRIYNSLLHGESISDDYYIAKHTPYVSPLDRMSDAAEEGKVMKEKVTNFIEQYNIPDELDWTEKQEFPNPDELSQSFEEFWKYNEINQKTYEKIPTL